MFLFSNLSDIPTQSFFIVGIVLYWLSYFLRKRGSSPAEYIITNKQILFKSISNNKLEIFNIPFSQMKNCIIIKDTGSKNGTIILVVKNPAAIPFDTYTIANNGEIEKRHQPSLENLREVDEVAKLIREGIKNAKA